jgi:fibronectin type 3 domain-containing protein
VQVNYATPQTFIPAVTVPFNAAQTAGNLNVVVVGWNDTTSQVVSVADTKGNTYQRAVGPTQLPGQLSQSIYFANNIAGAAVGTNTVTVTFNQGAIFSDIRVLEYSGQDPVNPVDVTSAATGNSTTSSTPAVTTTSAIDLLFAANMVASFTAAPGAGFTTRVITQPDGDIAEDMIVTAVGSYTSTASVAGGGSWVQQMVAFRAATTPVVPPGPPSNLAATAASSSQINLSWGASTGTVTSYLVESCTGSPCTFAQIATTAGTTYNNTGLTAGTTYSYRVRASDAAGNMSGYSNTASATTTAPPSPPSNLVATTISSSQINLSWTASNGPVGSYLVERCTGAGCTTFAQIASTSSTQTTYNNTGLVASTSYSYRVRADVTGYSNTASATAAPPPAPPTNLTATAVSGTQINLSWTASTGSVTSYLIESCTGSPCNFSQIATTAGTSYSATGLTAGTTYSYRMRASDSAGNLGGYSSTASATTTPPPSPPSNLTATVLSSYQTGLSWTASSGPVGAYLIERCTGAGCTNFAQIASTAPTQTAYSDTGLAASTSYTYRVRGDVTGYSNTAIATTAPPPTAPTNLTATAAFASQINLSWNASTGSVSLYLIERCTGTGCTFSQIATTPGTTYSNTGLAGGTTYNYRVRASDAAGNLGGYSSTASAQTPGQPPIASSNFPGFEDPLFENGAWAPITSLSPQGTRFEKNNGAAYPDRWASQNHAGARTTAAISGDHYSEIVVGHLGDNNNNVGPIVRVQASGPSIDSHYLWWASRPGGHNFLYFIQANGSSYGAGSLVPTSPVTDGDRLRLIARGNVLYGIKNGVRDFVYNTGQDQTRLTTGTTGMLAFVWTPTLTDAQISSWSSGEAPASSGVWDSSNFAGSEDPLDEGDRWYPLPGYSGFTKSGGAVIGKDGGHNASGAWSIAPLQRQYSEVTLGAVGSGGGGPVVRIDRNNTGQTGFLLFLWADNPSQSGLYQMFNGFFVNLQFFTPTIVTGDKWRLLADGNVLSVFRNGVLQFQYTTDGSYPTGDVGIEAYTPAFTFTAWQGGDPTGH